jgi:hypothetical protein
MLRKDARAASAVPNLAVLRFHLKTGSLLRMPAPSPLKAATTSRMMKKAEKKRVKRSTSTAPTACP